jgi:hypothetical protein
MRHKKVDGAERKDASLSIRSSPLQYLAQGCKAKCTCFSFSNNVGNGVVPIKFYLPIIALTP